jgi:amino-acid N-acetyltransferase
MRAHIERATDDDGPAILQLLSTSGLPVDGLLDHLDTAFVARVDDCVVGCAALEVYRDGALLRSVAVDAQLRGRGLGRDLTQSALALAHSLRLPAVYLLTTTADRFFARFAFSVITRDHVPPTVQQSVEFRAVCPASAVVMRKALAESRQEPTRG